MVMPSDSAECIQKTNDDVEAWMDGFYIEGRQSEFNLHCLWAWQEQERRHRKVQADLLDALETIMSNQTGLQENINAANKARAAISRAKGGV